jgi:ribosome maturation factor RimP
MAKGELNTVVEPKCRRIADEMGFELVDVALDREPTGKYLRIYIDRPEGISLDDCEAYHKAVRSLADTVDYDFMEVSSPGIDRPLKKDRDFERNLGSEIEIKLFKPLDGTKLLTGILAGLEDGEILLETPEGSRRIPRKAAALVKPVVDMEGIEEVDLSGDGQTNEDQENTESGEENHEV